MRTKDFYRTFEDGKVAGISGSYSLSDIEARTWVLSYRQTPYDQVNNVFEEWFDNTGGYWYDFDIVVLRLKFETKGNVYDLGTVSNKVNQDVTITGNTPKGFWERLLDWIEENWEWIVIGGLVIIALIILAPFLPSILSFLVQLFVLFIKGLIWVLLLPVKLIMALFGGSDKK